MKVIKVLAAVFLSFLLLGAQGALMGTFTLDKAFSPEVTTEAMKDSDFAAKLYRQTAGQNANALVQKYIEEALRTDAATKAMGNHVSEIAGGVLHGTDSGAFTKAELQSLTEDSLEELSAESGASLSDAQKEAVTRYIDQNADTIVREVNAALPAPQSEIENSPSLLLLQSLLSGPSRILLILFTALLGGLLIALFWKSKLGFVWWAVISAICGVLFLSPTLLTDVLLDSQVNTELDSLSLLLSYMFQSSFRFIGLLALLWSAILVLACIVLRKITRARVSRAYR